MFDLIAFFTAGDKSQNSSISKAQMVLGDIEVGGKTEEEATAAASQVSPTPDSNRWPCLTWDTTAALRRAGRLRGRLHSDRHPDRGRHAHLLRFDIMMSRAAAALSRSQRQRPKAPRRRIL